MFYQIDLEKKEVSVDLLTPEHKYIGMLSLEELKEYQQILAVGKQFVQRCENLTAANQNLILSNRTQYFGMVNLINSMSIFSKPDVMAFFIFKNMFLIVPLADPDQHIHRIFRHTSNNVFEKEASITRLVYYFFNELILQDNKYIEHLQMQIDDLEAHDTEEESLKFTKRLRKLSRELLLLRNYYDDLTSVGEELQMNYHDIFEADDMRYFDIFTKRLERWSKNVEMLREILTQANDSHHAKLDYRMNKTMQFFTVVTTIFMPLTLITGWYGMNFTNMPELDYPFSYFILIGVSAAVIAALVIYFKKKKYF